MEAKKFSVLKNTFYIIYICFSAFFLMNDYKIVTLVMMLVLAPTILFMEYYESKKLLKQG